MVIRVDRIYVEGNLYKVGGVPHISSNMDEKIKTIKVCENSSDKTIIVINLNTGNTIRIVTDNYVVYYKGVVE